MIPEIPLTLITLAHSSPYDPHGSSVGAYKLPNGKWFVGWYYDGQDEPHVVSRCGAPPEDEVRPMLLKLEKHGGAFITRSGSGVNQRTFRWTIEEKGG